MLYRIFLWEKINPSKFQLDWFLLNVGFVDGYYMVVLQNKKNELKHLVIVDNIQQPIQLLLDTSYNKGGYIVFNKDKLNAMPPKLMNKLYKRGLFMSQKKERSYNALTSIHRLVSCIDSECIGLAIHHINKRNNDNCIVNLVPVTTSINSQLENMYRGSHASHNTMLSEGYRLKELQEQKKINKKRYLKDNDLLQIEIIKYSRTHTTKETIKKFTQIKTPQTIRDIINYYYYKEEFLEWLKTFNRGKYDRNTIDGLLAG